MAERVTKAPLPRRAEAPSAFGSDVYERYTALYTWESNQVAHAGMGFFGAAVLVLDAVKLFGPGPWALLGLLFFVVPFMKDVTDFAIDRWRQHPAFPSDRRELILDWIADDLHWGAGIVFAVGFALIAASPAGWLVWIYWAAALAIVATGVLWSRRHFVPEKQAIDDAGLLYYSRLARFTGSVSDADANTVLDFLEGRSTAPAHLVVSGPRGTGKTEMALAIAAEIAIAGARRAAEPSGARRRVRYVSLDALVDALSDERPAEKAPNQPWPPMQAEVLVVDDLEDDSEVIAAIQKVLTELLPRAAKAGFRPRQFVWVAGDADATARWRAWIARTFSGHAIVAVWLGTRAEAEAPPYRWLENVAVSLPIFLGAASVGLWLFAPLGWWILAALAPGIAGFVAAGPRRWPLIALGAGFGALLVVTIGAILG